MTQAELAYVVRLRVAGWSLARIANETGWSRQAISYRLREHAADAEAITGAAPRSFADGPRGALRSRLVGHA